MEPEQRLAGKDLGNLAGHPVVCHDHALGHRLVDGQVLLGTDLLEALLLEFELHLRGLQVEGALGLPTRVPTGSDLRRFYFVEIDLNENLKAYKVESDQNRNYNK
jgi:hypothetical protein